MATIIRKTKNCFHFTKKHVVLKIRLVPNGHTLPPDLYCRELRDWSWKGHVHCPYTPPDQATEFVKTREKKILMSQCKDLQTDIFPNFSFHLVCWVVGRTNDDDVVHTPLREHLLHLVHLWVRTSIPVLNLHSPYSVINAMPRYQENGAILKWYR